jgi:16S rRNA (guanine527-N7)-methyltransferase
MLKGPAPAAGHDQSKIQNPKSKIQHGAAALNLALTDWQVRQFARYAALLEEWNARMNLTRIPPHEVVPLHFLDSLLVTQAVDVGAASHLLDVGSGAGFPGLPLKIAFPSLSLTLLDSTRKKLDFLKAVVADLALDRVAFVHARAEEAGRMAARREVYDLVTARAVAKMNILAEWLLPFVRKGGRAVTLKSAGAEAEIAEAAKAIRALGGVMERVVEAVIPGTDIVRKLVVIRKERPAPQVYPRAAAVIKSHPLK